MAGSHVMEDLVDLSWNVAIVKDINAETACRVVAEIAVGFVAK